ncbi:hypothetical protein GCM10027436_33700 [Actinophytocola sediminis]
MTNDENVTSDQYIGLLYSAPKATTACPAAVVPVDDSVDVDTSGKGFYRVQFTDANEWEDIGNSPIPAVVAAYTTQDARAIARGRPAAHRDRTVAEVEILLGKPELPAKLYDLPGHGSRHSIHDEIADNAWADADCFIYVTQATHGLSRVDLNLINRLHNHHVNSGKRVLWVMTGIDRAASANFDGQPEWKDAAEDNNNYLRENFPPATNQPDTFVGQEGFMPVSPAWEALGSWHIANGDEAKGKKLIAASRMRRLRRALTDIIDAGTGRQHITTIAVEARTLLAPRHQIYAELLDSARLPLDKLATERDMLARRLEHLKSAVELIRERLDDALWGHIRLVNRSFRELSNHLEAELASEIRVADLTKDKEANRIQVRKTQVLQRWVTNNGPVQVWDAEFAGFAEGVLGAVRSALRDTDATDALGWANAQVDLDKLTVPPAQKYRSSPQDVMQKVSGFVGLSTPVAGAVAASAGVIAGPFLAIPAGVTLIAGMVYGGIKKKRSKETALDVLRQEWIDGLGEAARHYQEAFVTAAALRGDEVIDRAIELLSGRMIELSHKIMMVEKRLNEPDSTDRGDLVARLEPHCQAGAEILGELKRLSR